MNKQTGSPAVTVLVQPMEQSLQVAQGTLLSDALIQAGFMLTLDCGGHGVCGSCRVRIEGELTPLDDAEQRLKASGQLNEGERLACRVQVLGDCVVELPRKLDAGAESWLLDERDLTSLHFEEPVIRSLDLQARTPSLEDSRADVTRILEDSPSLSSCKHPYADYTVARALSLNARSMDWQLGGLMRGEELIGLAERDKAPLGLAVDIGSTKLAAYLIDLKEGTILASRGRVNPQISYGADVVTRLQKAISDEPSHQRLVGMIRSAIQDLVEDLVTQAGVSSHHVAEACFVGNTVMSHLYADLPLKQLGAPPFVACMDQALDIKARELGLDLAPGAFVHLPPSIGGYVGADNVAMILGADLDKPAGLRLGLDIGTNTELVLSTPDGELFITSAPSGPTFEGAHLSSGMRALSGAISRVVFDEQGTLCSETVDGSPAAGLCGSGSIDALAQLLNQGWINDRGHLNRDQPKVLLSNKMPAVALVNAENSAHGQAILLTQKDISQIQLAKAAIHAAATSLLQEAGILAEDLDEVLLAGSFGSHIDVASARRIGLVPDCHTATYKQLGNAAGAGARHLLNDHRYRRRATEIASKARYLELSNKAFFKTAFAKALRFS